MFKLIVLTVFYAVASVLAARSVFDISTINMELRRYDLGLFSLVFDLKVVNLPYTWKCEADPERELEVEGDVRIDCHLCDHSCR